VFRPYDRTVNVERIDDAGAFLDAARAHLLADEARHNLLLGIAGTLRDQPSVYPEFGLWLVLDREQVVGAALRTPPLNLVLAQPAGDSVLHALVEDIDDELPGVVGALPEVEVFASAWSAKTGRATRSVMGQGVYALERVRPMPTVDGVMRSATEDDRQLLYMWLQAFRDEALPEGHGGASELEAMVDSRLAADGEGFVFWEDGGPVSFAGFGGHTPNGIRVGPVYTPPERRGRGYASALVAELSTDLLARGHTFCFLYTDLANPTSNRIYERIGYDRVCESAEIAFGRG
jgi:uncharacterized protein